MEKAPVVIKAGVKKEEADELKKKLEAGVQARAEAVHARLLHVCPCMPALRLFLLFATRTLTLLCFLYHLHAGSASEAHQPCGSKPEHDSVVCLFAWRAAGGKISLE